MKLVRDSIPETLQARGDAAYFHTASDEEYWALLKEKIIDEALEFRESGTILTIVDILSVINALASYTKITLDEMLVMQAERDEKFGGYEGRVVMEDSLQEQLISARTRIKELESQVEWFSKPEAERRRIQALNNMRNGQ